MLSQIVNKTFKYKLKKTGSDLGFFKGIGDGLYQCRINGVFISAILFTDFVQFEFF